MPSRGRMFLFLFLYYLFYSHLKSQYDSYQVTDQCKSLHFRLAISLYLVLLNNLFGFILQVKWLVDIFRGKIVDISNHSLTIEVITISLIGVYAISRILKSKKLLIQPLVKLQLTSC